MKTIATGIFTVAMCVLCEAVFAERVRWPSANGGNNHWYEVLQGPFRDDGKIRMLTWSYAADDAQSRGGYLATLNSAEENDFVFGLIDAPEYWYDDGFGNHFGPWLGGRQAPTANAATDAWSWVSGESFEYANWHSGEPNDFFASFDEDCLVFFAKDGVTGIRSAFWNDENGRHRVTGSYVVEYVPEPSIAGLALLIALALGSGVRARLGDRR